MNKLRQVFRAAIMASGVTLVSSCSLTANFMGLDGDVERPLTDEEIMMARDIFGDHIDYSIVKITRTDSNYNRAFHNRVRMTGYDYSDNYALERKRNKKARFIHELTHIWQEQQGKSVVGRAIGLMIINGFDYSKAYDYEDNDVPNFEHLNIEQQAEIVEHYYKMRESNKDIVDTIYDCDALKRYEGALAESFIPVSPVPQCKQEQALSSTEQPLHDLI